MAGERRDYDAILHVPRQLTPEQRRLWERLRTLRKKRSDEAGEEPCNGDVSNDL